MKILSATVFILLIMPGLYLLPFRIEGYSGVDFDAKMIVVFNAAVFVTAFISYMQLILPKRKEERVEHNRVPFQVFNMIFVVVFFIVNISFLISNKSFFLGDNSLNNTAAMQKYYLSHVIYSVVQIFIASSLVVNVIYILTHVRDYSRAIRRTSVRY